MVISLEEIALFIDTWMENTRQDKGLPDFWRGSLCSFLSCDDPGIEQLRQLVREDHFLPEDFLSGARSVLCFFLPFKPWVGLSNAQDATASETWAQAYIWTNSLAESLGEALIDDFRKRGIRAAYPYEAAIFPPENPKSRWSHRHLAYFAGMGSFGINNLLISKKGSLGRYFTLITDLEVPLEQKRSPEYCLYKIDGSCRLCVDRCQFDALGPEGFDRFKCLAQLNVNKALLGASVCGKCAVKLPCSLGIPEKRQKKTFFKFCQAQMNLSP